MLVPVTLSKLCRDWKSNTDLCAFEAEAPPAGTTYVHLRLRCLDCIAAMRYTAQEHFSCFSFRSEANDVLVMIVTSRSCCAYAGGQLYSFIEQANMQDLQHSVECCLMNGMQKKQMLGKRMLENLAAGQATIHCECTSPTQPSALDPIAWR